MANHAVIIREVPSQDAPNYRHAIFETDIDNGHLVTLTALKEGEREVWMAKAPEADSELWFVSGTELMYDEKKGIRDYTNIQGVPFRVERARDMIQAVSKEGLTIGAEETDLVRGAAVVCVAGETKMAVKATAAAGDVVVGKVIDVFVRAGMKFASIQFAHEASTVA